MALPPVFIEFLGSATGFMATAKGVKTELATVERQGGKNMAKLGGVAKAALLGIGVAAGVAAVKTVHMAADFQTQMTRVRTGAGEAAKNMNMVGAGVLKMAGQVGESTSDLTSGLYLVESAGYHGADALKVLHTSAQGAKVGAADLATVTDAVTTAMNAYKLKASDTTSVMNALVGTEAEGKTNLEALAGSMSGILPVAAAAHVGLNEILGAMATMTAQGTEARVGATYLRQTIGQLANPSAKAAATMKGLGLNATKVSQELGKKGLAATLDTLTDAIKKKMGPDGTVLINTLQKAASKGKDFQSALEKATPTQKTYIGALSQMVGGTKSMMGALELTGPHMADFRKNVAGIGKHVKDGGKEVEGWSDVQKTFNQRMAEFKGSAEALGISIGQKLLPAATRMAEGLSKGLLFLESHKDVLKVFGVMLAGVTIGLAAASIASWSFTDSLLANPITWIVAGIIALVAGLALLIIHWKQVWGWIKTNTPQVANAFKATWNGALRAFHAVWDWAVKAVHVVVKWFDQNVLKWVKARVGELVSWWHQHSAQLAQVWKAIWTLILTYVKVAWDGIKIALDLIMVYWRVAWGVIVDAAKLVWSIISGVVTLGMHYVMNTIGLILDIITGKWGRVWGDIKHLVGQTLSDLWHLIKDVGSKFGTLLYDAGKNLVQGLINGVKNMAGAAMDAVKSIAHGAMDAFKSAVGIKSPSRVFHQFGVWINEGLVNGLTGSQSKVRSAIMKTANMLTGLASGKKLRGLEHYVSYEGAQLERLARQRDNVAKRLKSAQAALKSVQADWTSTRNDVASNIMQGASVVMSAQDDGAALTAGDIVANMQDQVAAATQFATNLAALKKKGLSADLIKQIADAGVDGGAATAQALMNANAGQIKSLNGMQSTLGKTANATGKTVADSMYGAGINAAKGLVKGLQSQESAIEKQMLKIAKGMEKAIKHALGIHSPSRLFHEIGQYVTAGLVDGVDSGNRDVQSAAVRLSDALVRGTGAPTLSGSAVGSGAPAVVHAVHIEVHGSVRSDRDLRDVIQQEMYRYGGRNSVTWQQFKR
jgi:TP901 family phage tail tape measure protein